jgi:hypothetical protein
LTALELRKWHRDGWGDWLPHTDTRVPVKAATIAVERHAATGMQVGEVYLDGADWGWRVKPAPVPLTETFPGTREG